MAVFTEWVRRCERCRTIEQRKAWDDPASAQTDLSLNERSQWYVSAVLAGNAKRAEDTSTPSNPTNGTAAPKTTPDISTAASGYPLAGGGRPSRPRGHQPLPPRVQSRRQGPNPQTGMTDRTSLLGLSSANRSRSPRRSRNVQAWRLLT